MKSAVARLRRLSKSDSGTPENRDLAITRFLNELNQALPESVINAVPDAELRTLYVEWVGWLKRPPEDRRTLIERSVHLFPAKTDSLHNDIPQEKVISIFQ